MNVNSIKIDIYNFTLSFTVESIKPDLQLEDLINVFNYGVSVGEERGAPFVYLKQEIPDEDEQLISTFPIHITKGREGQITAVCNAGTFDDFIIYTLSNLIYFFLYENLHLDVFPIHGATIIKDGEAVLLCGKSGVGKSTCYHAANGVWEQGADDLAVVKREKGSYFITPFPTWSNFTDEAKDSRRSWDTSKSYPLKAIYLLQHGDDTLEKVAPIYSLMTFYDQISLFYKIFDFKEHIPEIHREKLKTMFMHAENISKELPVFTLAHKLGGNFLSLIEESLNEL